MGIDTTYTCHDIAICVPANIMTANHQLKGHVGDVGVPLTSIFLVAFNLTFIVFSSLTVNLMHA